MQTLLRRALEAAKLPGKAGRVELDADDPDGQSLLLWYPSVTAAGNDYIRRAIKIESGAKSALDPHSPVVVRPFVADDLAGRDLSVHNVTTVDPSRTFWDKVVILHGLRKWFERRGELRGGGQRVSRHYYDVARILCRDLDAARKRFGVAEEEAGMCYTRTGRRFFADSNLEREFLNRVRAAADKAGLWDELGTEWLCLDCELMPWSAKAQDLLRQQYAPAGAAARAGLSQVVSALKVTADRLPEAAPLLEWYEQRAEMAGAYVDAYRRYCWTVRSLLDLKLAPFHLLASEGAVHTDKDHQWHMAILGKLADADREILLATPHKIVNLQASDEVSGAVKWWEDLTGSGGEGMVVKPFQFVARNKRGMVQPAVKCRGREYLRIIYGPEYTASQNLERLRSRGLSAKRSLALREFALGIESLQRFVEREPLRRVHECAFAVLALESEPVDPRL